MIPSRIQVTILTDSGAPSCEGDCAVNWLQPENQALARDKVRQKAGEEAAVEFLDIQAPTGDRRQAGLIGLAGAQKLPSPVLFLNGQPRIAGPFDIRMLLDIIEVEMEREL